MQTYLFLLKRLINKKHASSFNLLINLQVSPFRTINNRHKQNPSTPINSLHYVVHQQSYIFQISSFSYRIMCKCTQSSLLLVTPIHKGSNICKKKKKSYQQFDLTLTILTNHIFI